MSRQLAVAAEVEYCRGSLLRSESAHIFSVLSHICRIVGVHYFMFSFHFFSTVPYFYFLQRLAVFLGITPL